ncbi:hypothetical protein D3C87_1648600 [compost metagenome]
MFSLSPERVGSGSGSAGSSHSPEGSPHWRAWASDWPFSFASSSALRRTSSSFARFSRSSRAALISDCRAAIQALLASEPIDNVLSIRLGIEASVREMRFTGSTMDVFLMGPAANRIPQTSCPRHHVLGCFVVRQSWCDHPHRKPCRAHGLEDRAEPPILQGGPLNPAFPSLPDRSGRRPERPWRLRAHWSGLPAQ